MWKKNKNTTQATKNTTRPTMSHMECFLSDCKLDHNDKRNPELTRAKERTIAYKIDGKIVDNSLFIEKPVLREEIAKEFPNSPMTLSTFTEELEPLLPDSKHLKEIFSTDYEKDSYYLSTLIDDPAMPYPVGSGGSHSRSRNLLSKFNDIITVTEAHNSVKVEYAYLTRNNRSSEATLTIEAKVLVEDGSNTSVSLQHLAKNIIKQVKEQITALGYDCTGINFSVKVTLDYNFYADMS